MIERFIDIFFFFRPPQSVQVLVENDLGIF